MAGESVAHRHFWTPLSHGRSRGNAKRNADQGIKVNIRIWLFKQNVAWPFSNGLQQCQAPHMLWSPATKHQWPDTEWCQKKQQWMDCRTQGILTSPCIDSIAKTKMHWQQLWEDSFELLIHTEIVALVLGFLTAHLSAKPRFAGMGRG